MTENVNGGMEDLKGVVKDLNGVVEDFSGGVQLGISNPMDFDGRDLASRLGG